MQTWAVALGATMAMQTVASFMNQSLPIVAPLLTGGAGMRPESIGNVQSMNALGVVLFLTFGGPALVRLGPVRMLQAGAVAAAAGLLLAASGWLPMLLLAGLLTGFGYGPSPPAGSRILAATAPPRHRTLIFSIKQAGAPAGGALAGLVLAPVADRMGWPAALVVSVAVGLLAAFAIAPLRDRLDIERDPAQPIGLATLLRWDTLRAPYAVLKASLPLATVTALAVSYALVQGCLFSFTVTYLSVDRGLPLATAGSAYAAMQACGVFARILLGWLADRTGRPAVNLTVQAFAAAAAVAAFAAVPAGAPAWLFAAACAACGFLAASWNGITMAEVVRLAPPGLVAEATAGSTVFVFLGYMVGPSLFASIVTWAGWQPALLVMALQLAAMACVQAALLLRTARRPA
jgi:MFS family permease